MKHDANTYNNGAWLMSAMWLRNKFGLSCFKSFSFRYDLSKDLQISYSLMTLNTKSVSGIQVGMTGCKEGFAKCFVRVLQAVRLYCHFSAAQAREGNF